MKRTEDLAAGEKLRQRRLAQKKAGGQWKDTPEETKANAQRHQNASKDLLDNLNRNAKRQRLTP